MMPERQICTYCVRAHCAEKVCDTILYDETDNLHHSTDRRIDSTSVIATARYNQLEAFASDLGDN